MTMITFLTGLVHAVLFLALLVHLRPALGFISGVGVGDANNISCLEGERQALLEFKKGLVDDYGKLSSWRSEDENKNCCNWEGVLCNNQTGHVVELHLGVEFPPLRGMISPSLLELPCLTFLDLSGNDFKQIYTPEFIGSLSNLKYLDLSRANLTGPIPLQLENLLHLQYLNLSENDLKIIDFKWLSHLSSLEGLALNSINLSSVANDWLEVVSHLPNLTTLSMSMCDLPPMSPSSLPHLNHLKSHTSLESLDLRSNQLVHIPKSFGDICTLRELYLHSNNLNEQLVELVNNLSGCAKDSLEVLGNVILREVKSTDPASLPSPSSAKSRPSWKSKSAKENAPPFDLTSIPSESKPSPAMVAKLKSPLPPRPPPSNSHKTKLSIESHGLDVGNC
ncbi:receptor-like protein eix2 [Quercus suber]|uniref:Receptor-like protein eix2 n=1 Tax=Quercus suber TaxID=58331 RepID=A0AAW0LFN8_QUESU